LNAWFERLIDLDVRVDRKEKLEGKARSCFDVLFSLPCHDNIYMYGSLDHNLVKMSSTGRERKAKTAIGKKVRVTSTTD